MAVPLKLGLIEQQHLQELYEAAGVPRDELPYSPALTRVCRDFQDRTFKNADEGQVFGAMVKYVRSSRCPKGAADEVDPALAAGRAEQASLLRAQHAPGRKIEPYTAGFESARKEFAQKGGPALSPQEFWRVLRLAAARPPSARGRGRTGGNPGALPPRPAAPVTAAAAAAAT